MNKAILSGKVQKITKERDRVEIGLSIKSKYNEYDIIDIEFSLDDFKQVESKIEEDSFISLEGTINSYIREEGIKQLKVHVSPDIETIRKEKEEKYTNIVDFKGILDKDAFYRKTAKGRSLTNLFVKQEQFTGMSIRNIYVPIVLWNKEAEESSDLKENQTFEITGATLHTRTYTKDGIERKVHELVKGN